MTTEEKAKAYDEVLITRADVQDFFPELQESEDEKMRNWILDELRLSYHWAAGD